MKQLAAILLTVAAFDAATAASPVTGRWKTDDGKAIVEIGQCGATVCGRIMRILAPTPNGPPRDDFNPDPKLRNRPIQGMMVLTGFTEQGNLWKGHIYSPEEGKTYRSTLRRNADGTLRVQGCIAIFCKSIIWTPAR